MASFGASAQRADTNLVTEAADAFGYASGAQSLGLYGPGTIRGFSPSRAGNVRLQGLYFDRQGALAAEIVASSRVRVGFNATGLAFAAPSGVVDYALDGFGTGDGLVATAAYGPFSSRYFGIDGTGTLAAETVSIAGGASYRADDLGTGVRSPSYSAGAVLHGAPGSDFNWSAFAGEVGAPEIHLSPALRTSGAALPVHLPRGHRATPTWAAGNAVGRNAGATAEWAAGNRVTIEGGIFWSRWTSTATFDHVIVGADRPDQARSVVNSGPGGDNRSLSGEVRAVVNWAARTAQRTVVSVRGRDQYRRFGGVRAIDLGQFDPNGHTAQPRGPASFGPQEVAQTDTTAVGIAQQGSLGKGVSFNVGALRVLETQQRASTVSTRESREGDWLLSGSLTAKLSPSLVAFAGYTEGTEGLGAAPATAANPYELLPYVTSTQRDIGLQFKDANGITAQVAVFELHRPFAGPDANGRYALIGDLSNRGVEASLRAQPLPSLTVLAGALWMDPEVLNASTPRQAGVDRRPVGLVTEQALVSASYQRGEITLDASVTYLGGALLDASTGLETPSKANLDLGARWSREVAGISTTVRLALDNVTDRYSWTADPSGAVTFDPGRRASITATFSF